MAAVLSLHSSNPLHVGSSDSLNNSYRLKVAKARRAAVNDDSDDPLSVYGEEQEKYVNHLSKLKGSTLNVRHSPPVLPRGEATRTGASLGQDGSDDELQLIGKDEDMSAVDVATDEQVQDVDGGEQDVENEVEMAEMEQDEDQDHSYDDDVTLGDAAQDEVPIPASDEEEEFSIDNREPEERDEILSEIADLEAAVPSLRMDYKLLDRLGTGTFSSVYKAIDLRYHEWYNIPWQGAHPPNSSARYQSVVRPPGSKVFVAIKRIYVTSSPERIRNEISILETCRGCRHVCQLITAFRERDQVVVIMPYQRNADFRTFFKILPLEGVKSYFRCLFRALRDIHSRGIIHRDVKPANFLFDPRTGIGTLCDFGLACRVEQTLTHHGCLHTGADDENPHGVMKKKGIDYDPTQALSSQRKSRRYSATASEKVGYPDKDPRPNSKANRAGTRGFRAPEVLLKCGDQTGAIDVWAAGMILLFFLVGKFPLFQSNDDTEALLEITSIIGRSKMARTASLHNRTFSTNIPTISDHGISWKEFVEKQNPDIYKQPDHELRYYPYSQMNEEQLATLSKSPTSASFPSSVASSPSDSPSLSSSSSSTRAPSSESYRRDIGWAFHLVEDLLKPESVYRLTAKKALQHPFLKDPEEPDDDEFFPHPYGKGTCAKFHFRDTVTDQEFIKIKVRVEDSTEQDDSMCLDDDDELTEPGYRTEVRPLEAGQGIAIGRQPCEFHKDMF